MMPGKTNGLDTCVILVELGRCKWSVDRRI
jgi:hypothetical protein